MEDCCVSLYTSFQPNNYVFPGGMIDKADFSTEWMDLYQQSFTQLGKGFSALLDMKGPRPPMFQKSQSDVPTEIALRICAIRETFEESGVLLLKRLGEERNATNCTFANTTELLPVPELQSWREQVHHNASNFLVMCRLDKWFLAFIGRVQ